MRKVLIVEDEIAIARVIAAYLQKEQYEVITVHNGAEATEVFDRVQPHLVLLDVHLPGMDGWEILTYIRDKSVCPVIMLTALSETEKKLTGLNLGADDYMTKPFVGAEVVARVNAVLRRFSNVMERRHVRQYGSLKIDFQSHDVYLNGAKVVLTPRDLSVLMLLAENPNQVFTREHLLDTVWGMDYDGSDRAVDLVVKRIRKALENWPTSEGEIRTMHRMGYQFHVHDK
ncbi:response regulator transcription factor [Paenibacillus roseipurpureus]|uniref:Response regulator transcription factor n=1 Tax=Paenibacillus roseopurpureus TaxID=2918901 RepID=A0AA96RKZ6_9BACL|nr:response regulator transcription factor [Paenibacillus sp. MBLB1832]WNR44869.1 response regulator transcription factor [Paenibacillus sp. MBLB1832]